MKKTGIFILVVLLAFAALSCTTYDKKPFMKTQAGLSAEGSEMWSRPTEVGYEIIGDVEGTVEYSTLFGFIPLSDTPASADITGIFGSGANDIAAQCAAYDAMQTVGADGIYVLSIYSSKTNSIFTTKETVTVKGKALKLVDLGTIDEDRADTVRYLGAAGGLDKTNLAPNIKDDGTFGSLGSLFSFGF